MRILSKLDGLNRHESEFLYEEIFVKQSYLRHGLRLPENAVVFDVGANIGMFSLFVSTVCPTAEIYAFEPLPPIYEKLVRNLSTVKNRFHPFCIGLSHVSSEVEFTYYPGYSTMSVLSSYADTEGEKELIRQQLKRQQDTTPIQQVSRSDVESLLDYRFREISYKCKLRSLSEIVDKEGVGMIDFLKIDVQRAEVDVLEGIREEHWNKVKQIAMEVHDSTRGASTGRVHQVVDSLSRRGFDVVVEQDAHLVGTDRHNLFASRQK